MNITPELAAKLAAIASRLTSQDNRITDRPIFIVEERRRLYGMDPEYADDGGIVWRHWGGHEADADEHSTLESNWDETEAEPDGWTRTTYIDQWHFVTACFTEKGCEEYIERMKHRHGELRIFAAGSYRNEEWQTIHGLLTALAAELKEGAM